MDLVLPIKCEGIHWHYMEISHFGVNGPTTLNEVQEELEEFGFVSVDLLPAHPSPVFKWPLFKNIQNTLIFGVVHMNFYCPFY